MSQHRFAALQAAAARSRLGQAAMLLQRGWSSAWDSASVSRHLRVLGSHVRTASPARRLRVAALIVAWAWAWYLTSFLVLPAYATSGLPKMWFAAAAVFAALLSLAADPIATGWGDSRLARMARSIRQATGGPR